jgi:isopenicillin N synthase-like dioxygenase
MPEIPSFDLEQLSQGVDLETLREALRNVGFIYIKNHGIPQDLIERFFAQGQQFFDRPVEYKQQYPYVQQTNAGWLRIGEEKLNGQFEQLENKEAYNFRKDFTVTGPEPFQVDTVREMIEYCHKTCMVLLTAFARCLEIPNDFFTSRHRFKEQSGDVLRCLHYPKLQEYTKDLRGGGHSDFGSLTLLFTQPNDPGGLEIVKPHTNDSFLPVPSLAGHIIVNTGDLMEYWTGSFFRSTIHRVIVPPATFHLPRYSVAYFCHAESQTSLDTIPSPFLAHHAGAKDRKALDYEDFSVVKLLGTPKTAHEHLMMRLERIHAHNQ